LLDVMPCCLVDGFQHFTVLYSPSDWIISYPATVAATSAIEHGSSICDEIEALLNTDALLMFRGVTLCLAGCCHRWM